jgi:pimeloyl-ACP methyl ester carboxylesterase
MEEHIAVEVGPDRIDIAYERRGEPSDPAILLVMGVAAQLLNWPEGFCDALVEQGLQNIRFDNRDSGRSTHMVDAPPPDLPAALSGDLSSASYTLSHMAGDAVGLIDALGLSAVHVVGASMGGAIAQTMAIEHPERVLSLTSMMSTTGDMAVGQAKPETLEALFSGPRAVTREDVVAQRVHAASVVGSPGYPTDLAAVAEVAGRAFDRGHDDIGVARQAVASVASGDRTQALRSLDVPTLVIHGVDDPMCDVSGGRATAEAITGAELLLIDGMGHNLPPALWPRIVDAIAAIVARGEALAASVEPSGPGDVDRWRHARSPCASPLKGCERERHGSFRRALSAADEFSSTS